MNIGQRTETHKDASENQNFQYFSLRADCPKIHDTIFKKLMKILEKDQWALDMGVYSSSNVKAIIGYIIEAKSLQLWLGYNARPRILTEITGINFPNLKQLSIAHNQISSVEAITFMNFPKLEELQFRQNAITSISCLKKVNLPQLRVISLYRNCIKSTGALTSLKSNSMRNLWLQYEDDQPVQGQSVAILSKLQSSQLKSIAAATCQRIKQPAVEKALSRRFQNVKIYRNSK